MVALNGGNLCKAQVVSARLWAFGANGLTTLSMNVAMRCIFCKQDSFASRGVEHIIPGRSEASYAVVCPVFWSTRTNGLAYSGKPLGCDMTNKLSATMKGLIQSLG